MCVRDAHGFFIKGLVYEIIKVEKNLILAYWFRGSNHSDGFLYETSMTKYLKPIGITKHTVKVKLP